MNSAVEMKWSWIEGSHGMRAGILEGLEDSDLAFNPGGQNMPLGELLCQTGEIEHSYIQSFKTFKQDWLYHNTEAGITTSVERLKAWYQKLDEELKGVVLGLSDADLKREVERESGFKMPVEMQLETYLQALFIFFGKAVVYLNAMNKPLPQSIKDYIW
jgi:hypothetical protein